MPSSDSGLEKSIGKILGATALYVVFTIFVLIPINGLLFTLAWNWFVVPVFKLSTISLGAGIGLAIFVSVLFPRGSSDYWKPSEVETTDIQSRTKFFWRNFYGSISTVLPSKVMLIVIMLLWHLLLPAA